MTQNRYYSNLGQTTTLSGGSINNTQLSIQVTAPTNWPTVFPFVISVDPGLATEELMKVTSGSGTALAPFVLDSSVGRGFDGTTPQPHSAGALVVPKICQLDLAEPQQHLNLSGSASNAHGLPPSAWLGGQYQFIKNYTPSASATSITFSPTDLSAIPGSCTTLVVMVACKTSYTVSQVETLMVQINGATGTSYGDSYVQNNGNNTNLQGPAHAAATQGVCGLAWASASGANITARTTITFPFFQDNVWAKGYTFQSAASDTTVVGNSYTAFGGGSCTSVLAPISSLTFFPQHTPTSQFLANSLFTLYAY